MHRITERNPKLVWEALLEGNQRFAEGKPLRPNQDAERRAELTKGQTPRVCVFTCGDSRVPAEILFDAGLGDIFVIRTAGEIVDSGVMASLEYAVLSLGVEVVVVLGHESCGAVRAATDVLNGEGEVPTGHQRTIVEQITPSILEARSKGKNHTDSYERYHADAVGQKIMWLSSRIKKKVEDGTTALVSARYCLSDGKVQTVRTYGI